MPDKKRISKEVSLEEARGIMCPYPAKCQKCFSETDMWRMIEKSTPSIFGDYNDLWEKLCQSAEKYGIRSVEWEEYVEKTRAILERLRANIVLRIMAESNRRNCKKCSCSKTIDLEKLQYPVQWEVIRLINAVFDDSGF